MNPIAAVNKPPMAIPAGIRNPSIPKTLIIDGVKPSHPVTSHANIKAVIERPDIAITLRNVDFDICIDGAISAANSESRNRLVFTWHLRWFIVD